ncbi:MAG: hypothetical protein ACKO38_11760 [Planctomycetota bacterium]
MRLSFLELRHHSRRASDAIRAGVGGGLFSKGFAAPVDTPTRLVMTDTPDFDLDAYQKHLEAVEAAWVADLPLAAPPSVRPVLIVFAEDQQYRRFAPHLAGLFQQVAREPRADGFTARGIATSSWKETEPSPFSRTSMSTRGFRSVPIWTIAASGFKKAWRVGISCDSMNRT